MLAACATAGATASTPTRGSRGGSASTSSASETLAPRDHDGLEAGLVELARSRAVPAAAKGYDRNYRGGVTRDEIMAAHARAA